MDALTQFHPDAPGLPKPPGIDLTPLFDHAPTPDDLSAVFDGHDIDATFIDADDVTRYYSPFRIFSRPPEIIGRDIYSCHRAETNDFLRPMLDAYRSGDCTRYWEEDHHAEDGRKLAVLYTPLHDAGGTYLGTLETCWYL